MTDQPKPAPGSREEVEKGEEVLRKLDGGKWPNYLAETRKTRYPLKAYGVSLHLGRNLWGVGGYVSVPGVPTGILMRITTRPDIGESANLVRVYVPSGLFLTPEMLRKLADLADKYGVGMVHALTTSSNIEIPGIPKDRIMDFVKEVRAAGMDVGSTGDSFRNTTACVGPALCEYAGYDTLKARDDFYDRFIDYAKFPTFPHKFKVKFSGCPFDCTRSTQKADLAVIGSWEGTPALDERELRDRTGSDASFPASVAATCPSGALRAVDGMLERSPGDCTQCMECVRAFPGLLLPGSPKRFKVLVGGKLRGKKGPMTSKMLKTVDTEAEVLDLIERVVNVYTEQAARKERLGDLISRIGMRKFLDLLGEKEDPRQVKELRSNVFYQISGETREDMVKELRVRTGGG